VFPLLQGTWRYGQVLFCVTLLEKSGFEDEAVSNVALSLTIS